MSENLKSLQEIRALLSRINLSIFDRPFIIRCEVDNKYDAGRIFIQVVYNAKCNKTGIEQDWHGRKFYLSDHMTNDEIVKTCYAAFRFAVEREIMEGFTVDGIVLFNPHTNFEELLKVSMLEVSRRQIIGEVKEFPTTSAE